MDYQIGVGELEVQDFEQVASSVGADAKALGWFVVGVNVIKGESVIPRMLDVIVGEAMVVRRRVDLNWLKCITCKREWLGVRSQGGRTR